MTVTSRYLRNTRYVAAWSDEVVPGSILARTLLSRQKSRGEKSIKQAFVKLAVASILLMVASYGVIAANAEPTASVFTVLGSNSGPIPNATRAEPANLLQYGDQAILIDAGDAAAMQLAKAGVDLGQVQTIFISHLHCDHTGGLFAVISQRFQSMNRGKLTIYGPEGTGATVDGLIAAMKPATARMNRGDPAANLEVIEMTDGSKVSVGPTCRHPRWPRWSTICAGNTLRLRK
jgi:hypothetical protein